MLDLPGAMILAVVSTTIATAIHLAIVAAGSRAHSVLSDPSRIRLVRRLFALVLLGVGLSFLLTDLG
jgi:threonine/homoserine/homoserine lactone efflux protein